MTVGSTVHKLKLYTHRTVSLTVDGQEVSVPEGCEACAEREICQGACPLMTKNLTYIRDMMGGEVGKSVHFVSISIDPTRDTPAAMKEFAQTHDADHAGWTWITGNPDNLAAIVKKLGSYTDDPEAHTTQMLAANVRTAHWTKIAPNVPPQGVVERLRMLIEEDAAN